MGPSAWSELLMLPIVVKAQLGAPLDTARGWSQKLSRAEATVLPVGLLNETGSRLHLGRHSLDDKLAVRV